MPREHTLIEELSQAYHAVYQEKNVILSFGQFIEQLRQEPRRYIRNALQYTLDTLQYFGSQPISHQGLGSQRRYKLFDLGTEKGVPIISGESAQAEVVNLLASFQKSSQVSKLILLHGPNGSAKTSTVETIAHGMQKYSRLEEGAVYRFNWIFPAEKDKLPQSYGESGPIGFGSAGANTGRRFDSFALLDEGKIAAKIASEFKENPIFLIPMPYREQWLRQWIAEKEGSSPAAVDLPAHILGNGLSKKNFQIFENLLNAYGGDLHKVLRHVQVERFFYSKQYRIGLSTVEPQLSVDAREKQLTMDKNYANLPSVLQTISFYQAEGELVEANRGILEFSDLLKRPLESFKYLLNTIEKSAINLTSGTAQLDLVFIGTSNDKHLDAFKTVPDFSSFKGRMELVTVPYLLLPSLEERIYQPDVTAISKLKPICPHALATLCYWAVMTRLKQPDPSSYPQEHRALLSHLDPYSKVLLYEGASLGERFNADERAVLAELREKVWTESQGMVVYEGRFGASPREVRTILHRAAQNTSYSSLTPMAIFEELKELTKDRTIYEFLQFEPRGQYHDTQLFIEILKEKFCAKFEAEILASMNMADDREYQSYLKRYVDHVVAEIKKERLLDPSTGAYNPPSQSLMDEVEKVLEIKKSATDHRNALLSRIAAYKLEHPQDGIKVGEIFDDYMQKIKNHYYVKQRKQIEAIYAAMFAVAKQDVRSVDAKLVVKAQETFATMQEKFGYTPEATRDCLMFLLKNQKK